MSTKRKLIYLLNQNITTPYPLVEKSTSCKILTKIIIITKISYNKLTKHLILEKGDHLDQFQLKKHKKVKCIWQV
jgi:hypothetical protein